MLGFRPLWGEDIGGGLVSRPALGPDAERFAPSELWYVHGTLSFVVD